MTKIEEIARAIAAVLEWDYDVNRQYLEKMAEAAIEAMREPNEAMITRAWALIRSNLRYEEAYRHLIDAALEEKGDD